MEVLRVSATSNPNSVAGAIAGVIREKGAAELQTIGGAQDRIGGAQERNGGASQRTSGAL